MLIAYHGMRFRYQRDGPTKQRNDEET